jgi:hypothetical protein
MGQSKETQTSVLFGKRDLSFFCVSRWSAKPLLLHLRLLELTRNRTRSWQQNHSFLSEKPKTTHEPILGKMDGANWDM